MCETLPGLEHYFHQMMSVVLLLLQETKHALYMFWVDSYSDTSWLVNVVSSPAKQRLRLTA